MSRAALLLCILFGILNFSWGASVIPACEDQGPTEVYLDLSNMGIQRISKSLTSSGTVTCLNLADNEISTIVEESFDNLPALKYLNLARNHKLPFIELRKTKLPNLKSLVLDEWFDTGAPRFDPDYQPVTDDPYEPNPYPFEPIRYPYEPTPEPYYDRDYDRYGRYSTTTNRPQEINNVLSLPELRKLSLSGNNKLDNINRFLSVLDTPKLTHLYLTSIVPQTTINIPDTFNLTHLYLDLNRMDHIPGQFSQSLQHLSMESNFIRELCGLYCDPSSMRLGNMHNLQYLSLAYNRIQVIASDAFEHMENLLVLNLAGNQITHFSRHAFDNMSSLKNLTLDKNKLTSVPIICALRQLEVLSLKDNQITSFNASAFCNLPKLASLNLSGQGLTSIADGTFTNLGALSVLDLSSNDLHFLPTNWISSNNVLKVLHLDSNKFVDISNMSLEHLGQVESLSFGHNPFKMISVTSLSKLPPNASIDVSRDCL